MCQGMQWPLEARKVKRAACLLESPEGIALKTPSFSSETGPGLLTSRTVQ